VIPPVTVVIQFEESYVRELQKIVPSEFWYRNGRLVIAAVACFFGAWLILYNQLAKPIFQGFGFFGVFCGLLYLLIAFRRWYSRRRAITGLKQRPETWRFDSEGVGIEVLGVKMLYPWSSVTGWQELKGRGLVISSHGGVSVWMPTRNFDSPEDYERLRRMLEANVNASNSK
jgi:polyferredoxin